jgi:hypothetical protein
MSFKVLLALFVIIVRLFIGVKVISWLILKLISQIPHPISEIEWYLVLMFIDIWLSGHTTEIYIKKENE